MTAIRHVKAAQLSLEAMPEIIHCSSRMSWAAAAFCACCTDSHFSASQIII